MKLPVLFFKGNATRGQVLMLAFILLILTLGLFVIKIVKQPNELRPGEEYGVQYRAPGEIEITQVGDTKRVTDNRQNYSVTVPANWNIQEPTAVYDIFNFFDDTNGCQFSAGYSEIETTLEDFVAETDPRQDEFVTVESYKIEDFNLKNLFGKHTIFETAETGYFESLDFEKENYIFSISLGVLNSGSGTICSQELLQLAESLELR